MAEPHPAKSIRGRLSTAAFVFVVGGGVFGAVFAVAPVAALLVLGLFLVMLLQYFLWGRWLGGLLQDQANGDSDADSAEQDGGRGHG